MTQVLSESKPVARKEYPCMASEWIYNGQAWSGGGFTLSELKAIVRARRNKWRIMPGQRYVKQAIVGGGEFYVFRAIPELHAICIKYDLYEEA